MSGLSHTPGKRAWGKTHRGFESRLLRQKKKTPPRRGFAFCGRSILAFGERDQALLCFTMVIAELIKVDTSVMLLGTIKVVVASAATLP
jgi:hypothetical protein